MPASRYYAGGSALVGMSESERDWDEFDPKAREEREMGREMVDKARDSDRSLYTSVAGR
jgi:hypothetical protein